MEQQINYRETVIHFSDHGEGRALVFLHGYLLSHRIWLDFTRPLERDYRVICVDLPGHGDSGLMADVSSMEIMAETTEAVLDSLGVERAVVFGHSMGGYAALALLEKRPELFSALVLFHSHPNADSPEVRNKRDREVLLVEQGHKNLLFSQSIPNMFANDRLAEHQRELNFCKSLATSMSDKAVTAAILGLKARPDRTSVLANAPCPCLLIAGKKDNFIPFQEVALQIELPVHAMVLVAEETGHMGFFEETEKIRDGIIQFLKSAW